MGFLDKEGLSYFAGKLRTLLAGKQDTLTPDETITMRDGGISVRTPVKPLTRAEYDALPEAEKQAEAVYLVEGSISDAPGLGGFVPPGAIIPFMGLHAPSGYLICDGKEYSISRYPALSSYFTEQFGSVNHFGGDGETTFAVPDMRNLFLRGYHGEAEEQLSGGIGARQDATRHPYVYGPTTYAIGYIAYGKANKNEINLPQNPDDVTSSNQYAQVIFSADTNTWQDRADVPGEGGNIFKDYTSRPANMAVLFCIKT